MQWSMINDLQILGRKLKIEQHEPTVFYQRLKLKTTDSGQKYSDASNIPYIFHIKQPFFKNIS
jgi:hypothetical protein